MDGTRQAIDQLLIVPHPQARGEGMEAVYLGTSQIADLLPGVDRCQVHWLHLPWHAKGAFVHYGSREEAIAAIRLWVSGLDIVPWD